MRFLLIGFISLLILTGCDRRARLEKQHYINKCARGSLYMQLSDEACGCVYDALRPMFTEKAWQQYMDSSIISDELNVTRLLIMRRCMQ